MFSSFEDLKERTKLFLIRIPQSLLGILGFKDGVTYEELKTFVERGTKLLQEDKSRHDKMDLQKEYELPIRPNQNWRELKTIIRIQKLKKKRQEGDKEKDDNNDKR